MKDIEQTLTVLCNMRNTYLDAPIQDANILSVLNNEIDKLYKIEKAIKG